MKYLNCVFITQVIGLKMSQYGNLGSSSQEVSKIYYILFTVFLKICLNAVDNVS